MVYIQNSFSTIQEYVFAIAGIWVMYKTLIAFAIPNRLTSRAKILDFKRIVYKNERFEIKQNG